MVDGFGFEETFSGYMVDFGDGRSYLDVTGLNLSGGHMGEFKGWITDSGFTYGSFTSSWWGDAYGHYFNLSTSWGIAFQLEGKGAPFFPLARFAGD
jgi:hypothetical protein